MGRCSDLEQQTGAMFRPAPGVHEMVQKIILKIERLPVLSKSIAFSKNLPKQGSSSSESRFLQRHFFLLLRTLCTEMNVSPSSEKVFQVETSLRFDRDHAWRQQETAQRCLGSKADPFSTRSSVCAFLCFSLMSACLPALSVCAKGGRPTGCSSLPIPCLINLIKTKSFETEQHRRTRTRAIRPRRGHCRRPRPWTERRRLCARGRGPDTRPEGQNSEKLAKRQKQPRRPMQSAWLFFLLSTYRNSAKPGKRTGPVPPTEGRRRLKGTAFPLGVAGTHSVRLALLLERCGEIEKHLNSNRQKACFVGK